HAGNQSRILPDLSLVRPASHNGIYAPLGTTVRIRKNNCVLSGAVLGGGYVRESVRCSAGVEETRLHRRGQVQGDVRALAQGSERLLGGTGQAPPLAQGAEQDQEQLVWSRQRLDQMVR